MWAFALTLWAYIHVGWCPIWLLCYGLLSYTHVSQVLHNRWISVQND